LIEPGAFQSVCLPICSCGRNRSGASGGRIDRGMNNQL
jgi:hypothetical protein